MAPLYFPKRFHDSLIPRHSAQQHVVSRFNCIASCFIALCCISLNAFATPSTSSDIAARRGSIPLGKGETTPTLTLAKPTGGWTSNYMLDIEGTCSDVTADPITAAINGIRYYIRSQNGAFARKFPAAKGQNSVTVECANKGGVARETRTITGVMSPVRLKVVLTSDTDGVYTDLHLYEPSGNHVYWASTTSPTGGLFFLNSQGESGDQPGYGPYMYVHPAPPIGVYRIDVNYWPGGAVQHTLASLDIVTDEGLPTESRRRVKKPLARPGETQTLAYVIVKPNNLPIQIFVPGQDHDDKMPPEVRTFKHDVEPTLKNANEYAFLPQSEEEIVRRNVTQIALAQAKFMSPRWQSEQRDCAGLVRFAYREAVAPRTEKQIKDIFNRSVPLPALQIPIGVFFQDYPRLWMTGFGRDGSSQYGFFADAENLLGFNFRQKGRTLQAARAGDLLAFKKEITGDAPYHLMIYGGPDPVSGVAVYHTGSEPIPAPRRAVDRTSHAPMVRIVSLSDLLKSPDATWLPVSENPHFLGVFEWKKFKPKSQSGRLGVSLS